MRRWPPAPLVLPGNRCLFSAVDASNTGSMTSKEQVTIPKALRQQFGLARASRVCFELVGRGFGLLKSQRSPVPVDFDATSLLRP